MATLTGELISETYDSLLKVTDNNTITGIKKRITDGFGNDIPLLLSSTDLEIDGTLILSALTDLAPASKFLSLKADNSVGFRTSSELLSDIGGASSASISGTTGRLSKFTSSGAVGNSILNEIGNAIHLTDGTSSYASFGINNPGIDNDAYIGSTINNDFLIKVNNTEALRIDTAFRLKIANIQNADTDTDKFLVSEDGVVKYRTGDELRADIGAGVGSVTSVGLSMPVAFEVANSPITSAGTLAVTAVGSASQYIRGDGQLATLPTGAGGGSAVNYYLNGSVASGVAGYQQMDNTAIIGTGTDFNLTGNGLIAQFLTDAGNPNRLLIPGGAWNLEMFFQVSSSGGNAKFYVDLFKYDGTTFTSIASGVTNPEEITGGTSIDLYLTSLGVPETALLITDRLAIRVYIVDNSGGRTVTLHTEDNTLCQVTTTFAGGISALNGLTANTQYFAVGTSGTDFNISSLVDTHTFNIPSASATARGLITTGTQTIAGAKTFSVDAVVNGVNIGRGGGNLDNNTMVGNGAGQSNTTGVNNSFFGTGAGQSNTTGNSNLFFGLNSGVANTTGSNNLFFGLNSGVVNTTSSNNSFFGTQSGLSNTTGANNSFFGRDAASNNITGSLNTAIGGQAGRFISNGFTANAITNNSIYIGYNTKALANNQTNQIVIGHNAVGLGSNTTVLGNSSTTFGRWWGNLLIGDSTNSGEALQITGTSKFTGLATFSVDTIVNGVNIGRGGGSIDTNTRVGIGALNANTTGVNNTGFGRSVLNANTTGNNNTAFGFSSFVSVSSGSSNVSLGASSGRFIADGTTANTITNNSIYIGFNTKALADNQTNQTVIGYNAVGLGSNTTVLGNSSTTFGRWWGNLLIGDSTNSGEALQITGTSKFTGLATFSVDAVINGVSVGRGGGSIASNTRVGSAALNNNTTGNNNTAIGVNSLGSNNSGTSNSSFGVLSLFNNTTGIQNTSNGHESLFSNITGSGNISNGYRAGRYIANGSTANSITDNSIYIGNNTKALANNQTNQTVIGHDATGLGSNTTVLGNSSTVTTGIYGRLLLGSTTDNTVDRLQVTGSVNVTGQLKLGSTITNNSFTYTLPSATGTLALTSDLSAYVPYTGATGLVNLGAYDLTVNGVSVGRGGGAINTNILVGSQSGLNNTTGSFNSFFGSYAGNGNTTGSNNSFFGSYAGVFNTTGSFNTLIGHYAGAYINSGAINSISTNSVYLGYDTRASANGNTNEIVIGYIARGGGSNSATLGNSSIATTILHGNTSIGYTTNPSLYKLDVNGTGRFQSELVVKTAESAQGISIWGRSDDLAILRFKTQTGATTKAAILTLANDLIFELNGSNALTIASTGAATFSSSVTTGAPSGGTAKPFKVGAAATYGGAATFDRTIEIEIDGTTYYLAAKTTSS